MYTSHLEDCIQRRIPRVGARAAASLEGSVMCSDQGMQVERQHGVVFSPLPAPAAAQESEHILHAAPVHLEGVGAKVRASPESKVPPSPEKWPPPATALELQVTPTDLGQGLASGAQDTAPLQG